MEQVKGVVRDHLEKHKFFESLKSAVSKDPKLGKLDRNQIIDKLRSEGVLNEIISQLPISKKASSVLTANNGNGNTREIAATLKRKPMIKDGLDPKKRYLSCSIIKGSAFADFVNVRSDESIQIAASFLKNRFQTKPVQCSTDPIFDENFMFEFVGDDENIKFDAAMLLKLN